MDTGFVGGVYLEIHGMGFLAPIVVPALLHAAQKLKLIDSASYPSASISAFFLDQSPKKGLMRCKERHCTPSAVVQDVEDQHQMLADAYGIGVLSRSALEALS